MSIVENLFSWSGNPPTSKILCFSPGNEETCRESGETLIVDISILDCSQKVSLPFPSFSRGKLAVSAGVWREHPSFEESFFLAENFVSTNTHTRILPCNWDMLIFSRTSFYPEYLLSTQMRTHLETVKKNSGPFFLVHVPKVWWFVAAWIPPDHLDPTACPPDKPGPTKVQGVLSAAEQLSRSD